MKRLVIIAWSARPTKAFRPNIVSSFYLYQIRINIFFYHLSQAVDSHTWCYVTLPTVFGFEKASGLRSPHGSIHQTVLLGLHCSVAFVVGVTLFTLVCLTFNRWASRCCGCRQRETSRAPLNHKHQWRRAVQMRVYLTGKDSQWVSVDVLVVVVAACRGEQCGEILVLETDKLLRSASRDNKILCYFSSSVFVWV